MHIGYILSIIRPSKLKVTLFASLWAIFVFIGIGSFYVCFPNGGIVCAALTFLFGINTFLIPPFISLSLLWLLILYISSGAIIYICNKRYGIRGNIHIFRFLSIFAGLMVFFLSINSIVFVLFAMLFLAIGLGPEIRDAFERPRQNVIVLIGIITLILVLISLFYLLQGY